MAGSSVLMNLPDKPHLPKSFSFTIVPSLPHEHSLGGWAGNEATLVFLIDHSGLLKGSVQALIFIPLMN